MLYKYHYEGKVEMPSIITGRDKEYSYFNAYTVAKTEARAVMNLKWRLHKEFGVEISSIRLDPESLKVVGGYKGPGYPDNPDQVTLWDLFPEAMGVANDQNA